MFEKRLNKENQLLPWSGKKSIYQFIKEQLDQHGKIINDTLPDEEELYVGENIRFAPGAWDGVLTHHVAGAEVEEKQIKKLVKLIRTQVNEPTNKTRRATYLEVMDGDILAYIDSFLDQLRMQFDLDPVRLYEEALWFIRNGAHRGAVKFGIALLGLFRCDQDKELLLTLGKHDEFTLYTAVALQNGTENANFHLFELAKQVDGWGKIHLVERLEPETQEIKDWLLRHGCRNSVMDEYLAYVCAVKGDLHQALIAEEIDDELYRGAGVIISALISGGPAEDIDDYPHSYSVISNYLRHSQKLCKNAEDLYVVAEIKRFLEQDGERWEWRYKNGWTPEAREELLFIARSLIAREKWEDLIWKQLETAQEDLYYVIQVAKELSLDVWPVLFAKLQKDPLNERLYYELMQTTNRDRVRQLIRFAQETLPLSEVATGPALEMYFGEEYQIHRCLDHIVQDLDRFEGIGIKLIQTALQSPVIRNRMMAIKALEAWKGSEWASECVSLIENLAKNDPDEEVRQRAQKLLKKINK